VATVARHVYQGTHGGPTYCPLDRAARVVVSSTPKFAEMVSHKYAESGSTRVREDLRQNHGRSTSGGPARDVAEAVAAVAQLKQEDWSYALPRLEDAPAAVGIGPDGTCLLTGEDGRREAMVGTPAFCAAEGQRRHTVYLAATPGYGRAKFLARMEEETARAELKYPGACDIGADDGAGGNRDSPGRHTTARVVDFRHAAESLGKAAVVIYRGQRHARKAWLDDACHRLKHEAGGAGWVLKRLRALSRERPWARDDEGVGRATTYFENPSGAGRMGYAPRVEAGAPIGSGVTGAACQVIVKQRLCGPGMKWTAEGAEAVLGLRRLAYTPERWARFWSKVERRGFPVAA